MELKFSKSNSIRVSYSTQAGLTGPAASVQRKQYSVDLGTILYNDTFMNLNSQVIPLYDQTFFDLPNDKNKYAVVNIYYDVRNGRFVFDKIGVYDKYVDKSSALALFNDIPIAQFILHENFGSFEVTSYNEYSQMATFVITDTFIQGDTGIKADTGATGALGVTGREGDIGITGPIGETGYPGVTGASYPGITGAPGATGAYVDLDLLLYYKFKTSDIQLTDFSPYERDSVYSYTGIYNEDGSPLSYFTKESGVVDYCHDVVYNGGFASYSRNEFLDFGRETGTISSWIKLTKGPGADFDFSIDEDNPLRVHFIDRSTRYPTSWKWWMEYDPSYEDENLGNIYDIQNPIYTFPDYGKYIVKLKAMNASGYSEVAKFVKLTFIPTTAELTMEVDGVGATDPTGTVTQNVGEEVPILAIYDPDTGYQFDNWTVVGDAAVTDPNAASTTVTLNGNATVTAHFSVIPPEADFLWYVD